MVQDNTLLRNIRRHKNVDRDDARLRASRWLHANHDLHTHRLCDYLLPA
jgi:hypothetical protein